MSNAAGAGRRVVKVSLVALLVLASCTADPGGSPGERATAGVADESVGTLAFDAEPSEAADAIAVAIESLLAEAAVEARYQVDSGDGGSSTGAATIDTATGDFRVRDEYVPDINPNLLIVSERILLDDRFYVRILDANDEPADVAWDETEPGPLRDKLVGEATTAAGAAGASLGRLVQLLEAVPWVLDAAATTQFDDHTITSFLVRFSAEDIWQYFGSEKIELVGPTPPSGSTLYEFWIDSDTGTLVTLLAAGTQFQDGEPIEGAQIRIDYRPLPAATIAEPSPIRE